MKKIKNNFQYLDLNSSEITQPYRTHPASKPEEIYVAKLGTKVENEYEFTIVTEVYKLITKNKKFVKSNDGRNLVLRITDEEKINILKSYFDETFELGSLTQDF